MEDGKKAKHHCVLQAVRGRGRGRVQVLRRNRPFQGRATKQPQVARGCRRLPEGTEVAKWLKHIVCSAGDVEGKQYTPISWVPRKAGSATTSTKAYGFSTSHCMSRDRSPVCARAPQSGVARSFDDHGSQRSRG